MARMLAREPVSSSRSPGRTRDVIGAEGARDALAALGRQVGAALPRDPAAVRRRIETMERLLERIWVVPVLNRPVGLDVILDLVPGVGPAVGAAMGGWLAWEARNLGLSRWTIVRMGGNILLDLLLGAIPWIGAIPDFFFRSNSRNLRLVRRHLDRLHPVAPDPRPGGRGRRARS